MAWLIANEPTLCPDRERATEVGQRLVELGVLHHVVQKSKPFLDGYFFYRFAKVTSPVRALVLISFVVAGCGCYARADVNGHRRRGIP